MRYDDKKLKNAAFILKTKLLVSEEDMISRLEALTEADVRALASYVRMRDKFNKATTDAVAADLDRKGF